MLNIFKPWILDCSLNLDKLTLMMKMLTGEEKLIVVVSNDSDTTDARWLLKALFCCRLDVAFVVG